MDLKEHLSILNHFLIVYVEMVKNGSFLKPTVLRFEPRLMTGWLGIFNRIINQSVFYGANTFDDLIHLTAITDLNGSFCHPAL